MCHTTNNMFIVQNWMYWLFGAQYWWSGRTVLLVESVNYWIADQPKWTHVGASHSGYYSRESDPNAQTFTVLHEKANSVLHRTSSNYCSSAVPGFDFPPSIAPATGGHRNGHLLQLEQHDDVTSYSSWVVRILKAELPKWIKYFLSKKMLKKNM